MFQILVGRLMPIIINWNWIVGLFQSRSTFAVAGAQVVPDNHAIECSSSLIQYLVN